VTPRTPRRLAAALLAASLLAAAACGDDDSDDAAPTEEAPTPELADADALAAATAYADHVAASYDAVVEAATALQTAVHAFVDAPSDAGLAAAKQAWLDGRVVYGPTEAFRFYDGPIDDPEDGPEGRINAWPLDEAYIDYVEDDPDAGIVNDVVDVPEITIEELVAANEEGGETNISTGWHAIEFLLWGQDLSADGPGARPVSDYTTAPNAERRGTYLTLLADLLVEDLTSVRDEWDPASGAYRATFLADPHQALTDALRGMGALSAGELAGERIGVAYENQDQEDEHSCFSDNTTVDVLGNATGVQLAYRAISAAVATVAPELDAALRAQLDESVARATALPAPFDQLILGDDTAPGRVALLELITLLEDQGDAIARLGTELGYSVSISL
jgi:putative iron-regulated protein